MIAPTLARVPVLFRWNVNDGLNGQKLLARSFATELEGVLTRTSTKYVRDRNGVLVPLPRDLPPLDWDGGAPALLLEPQRTNLVLRSEQFADAVWTKVNVTVTANTRLAPDLQLTEDTLDATVAGGYIEQTITFTGDGEKCTAWYLEAGTAATSAIELWDNTAAVARHRATITWTAGVPSLSTAAGAGTLFQVERLGQTTQYRVLISATGIVAANSNRLRYYPAGTAGTGTSHAWGAQAENASVPSSYMPTQGSIVTRQTDSLYFPFSAPPQAQTVYVRGRERGTRLEPGAYIWQISQSNNNPRIHVNRTVGTARMQHQTVSSGAAFTTVSAPLAADASVGDLVEFRSTLASNGTINHGSALNNGAELNGTPVSGTPLEAAWSGQRLWIGSSGAGSTGLFAFTHICIAAGERSLAEMRELAGV